jgi:hypothetical protein
LTAQLRKLRTPEKVGHCSFFDSINHTMEVDQELAISVIRTHDSITYDIT